MTRDAELACRCGTVRGRVAGASPRTVNRLVCYCDDCQAFLHRLGRADLLDEHGGTDIVQVAPASLTFMTGTERIACLRLTPKGLYRWFADCCRTPLGNTVGPAIPFVGIVARAFPRADDAFGKPIGGIYGRYAVGAAPGVSAGLGARIIVRALRKVLGWRLGGKAWPHPFFDRATGLPVRAPIVLSPDDRHALRPLCGPRPGSE